MTKGEEFLFSVLERGDLETFVSVRDSWLFEPREASMYKFIMKYFTTEAELPPADELSKKFGIKVTSKLGTPTYYLKELKKRYAYSISANQLPDIVKTLKTDPLGAVESIRELLSDIDSENENTDVSYEAGATDRIRQYAVRKLTKGVTYLKYGIPCIDEALVGIDKSDLITIAGRSGLGKTWFLCYLLMTIQEVMFELGMDKPILVVSGEMPAEQLSLRIDSVMAEIDYHDLRVGALKAIDEKKYKDYLLRLRSSGSLIRFISAETIAEITAKAVIYSPAIILVDGSYLLEPDSKKDGWLKIQHITSRLKALAMKVCPVIQTTQLGRNTGKKKATHHLEAQDEFSFGLSYIQDSDFAIRMFQTADMVYYKEIGLDFAKFRHVDNPGTFLWRRLDNGKYEIEKEVTHTPATVAYGSGV